MKETPRHRRRPPISLSCAPAGPRMTLSRMLAIGAEVEASRSDLHLPDWQPSPGNALKMHLEWGLN